MSTAIQIQILNFIDLVKKKLYLFRPILRPVYHNIVVKKQKELHNKVFLSNAIDVLEQFDIAMKEAGFNYSLAFGTLLGAVREKGFIKHDYDIDVAMWHSDYRPELCNRLNKYGFRRIHQYSVENGQLALEETYILKGVSIDVFFFYPAIDEYPYCCDFLNHYGRESLQDSMKQYSSHMVARRIQLPLGHDVKYVNFDRLFLPIPINYEEILSFRYGPDYMIPNPKWSMTESYNKHITIWEGQKVEVH